MFNLSKTGYPDRGIKRHKVSYSGSTTLNEEKAEGNVLRLLAQGIFTETNFVDGNKGGCRGFGNGEVDYISEREKEVLEKKRHVQKTVGSS